jgi:hypothetical protein
MVSLKVVAELGGIVSGYNDIPGERQPFTSPKRSGGGRSLGPRSTIKGLAILTTVCTSRFEWLSYLSGPWAVDGSSATKTFKAALCNYGYLQRDRQRN